jgi:glycosyltransferase involved in cell wall biosynthesis
MRLLLVHNRYQFYGGEDAVFDFEASALEHAGHLVHRVVVSNDDIRTYGDRIRTALALHWSPAGYALVESALRRFKPDLMHVHNFFARLSPSIYDAAAAAEVPVVQSLHNFRVTCANGLLLRDGVPCEICMKRSPYNAVRFRCYRNSYVGSLTLAHMIAYHRRCQTWLTRVRRFIASSDFARCRFVQAGLPCRKIIVKPNGVTDPGVFDGDSGGALLYVGRLSKEKGVHTLVHAAKHITYPIRITGDGPLRAELESVAPRNVTFLGHITKEELRSEMIRARCIVVPSICYEGFPSTVAEAFSYGLPVVASRLGSLIEIVKDGVTGLHFAAGDTDGLAAVLNRIVNDDELVTHLAQAARREYLERYTPARIVASLEDIYEGIRS